MKTVVFGGTFNPVHLGHLYIADEIVKQTDYERLIFIPSNIPPHKSFKEQSPEYRVKMLEYALEGSGFLLDDCEIRRGGTSYTVDTVKYLYSKYDISGKIGLVIGDDLVEGFKRWHRWEDLAAMVDLLIVHRNYRDQVKCSQPHTYLNNLLIPVSSREIRRRVGTDGAYRYLVPEKVFSFINENKLYR